MVSTPPALPPEYTTDPTDWPTQNGSLANTRCATGSDVSAETIGDLRVAWTMPIAFSGPYGSVTASPIVIGATVYLIDMDSAITAIRRDTGEVRWRREFHVPTIGPNGLTVADGRLIAVLGDTAEVVALDAATGADIWRVGLSNNVGEGIDIAPIVVDDTVIVSTVPGNSLAFYRGGQRGIVYALDAATGGTVWQWDTTTGDLWGDGRTNSGGGIWNPPSVDEHGILYLGVANAAPYPGNRQFPNASSRPGPNDYANNVVALDPATVGVRWHVNLKPGDRFDLDAHISPILTTIVAGGVPTPIVVGSGKHGYVAAIDRASGVERWKVPVGTHQNDTLTVLPADERDAVRVYPGAIGGVETCMAVSERDGLVFVPVLNLPSMYTASATFPTPGGFGDGGGELVAIDLLTGQFRWQVAIPAILVGSATVANDVVLTGGLDGVLRAYRTRDGQPVWRLQLPAGLNAPPVVSGRDLFVAAGGALIPGPDSAPELMPSSALIALRLPD